MAEITEATAREIAQVLGQLRDALDEKQPSSTGTRTRRRATESDSDYRRRQEETTRYERDHAKTLDERIEKEKELLRLEVARTKQLRNSEQVESGLYKQLTKDLEKMEKKVKSLDGQAQGAQAIDRLSSEFFNLGSNMQKASAIFKPTGAGLVGLGKAMFSFGTYSKLASDALLKIVANSLDFAVSLDKQNALLKASTGAGNEYMGVISDVALANRAYGVSVEDARVATQGLFGSFRDFTELSEGEKRNIGKTTTILGKFGVEAGTTAKILDQATKSLYMNTTQAETLTRQAATLAIDIGKPLTEVANDLAAAAPQLAFYGQRMFEVFAKLERQSKQTGLSVAQLLGVFGEQFDTFEGAGQAVGRLNSILGGPYLNSINMLNAEEHERLQLVKESLAAANVQFDQLNKFEQKAFARALGTDVDTLRRSLGVLDPVQERNAMRQEELAKRAGEARSIMQKLTDAINSLVIASDPLITKLGEGIDKFTAFVQNINESDKGVLKLVGGLGLLAGGLKIIGFLLSPFRALPRLLGASTAAAGGLGGLLKGGLFGAAGAGIGMATSAAAGSLQASGNIGGAQAATMFGSAASGAAYGAGIGSIFGGIGAGPGALLGGALGLAKGVYDTNNINDGAAIVDNNGGKVTVTNLNSQDRIDAFVATKPGGTVDQASGRNTDRLVEAIAKAGNTQVNVQIGEKQLTDIVVTALNSFGGMQAISPFHQGLG